MSLTHSRSCPAIFLRAKDYFTLPQRIKFKGIAMPRSIPSWSLGRYGLILFGETAECEKLEELYDAYVECVVLGNLQVQVSLRYIVCGMEENHVMVLFYVTFVRRRALSETENSKTATLRVKTNLPNSQSGSSICGMRLHIFIAFCMATSTG
jgi:hypothetical protein